MSKEDLSSAAGQLSKLTCPICDKAFQWKSGLSRHFRLLHMQNKDKKYKCYVCDKVFYKQDSLNMHLKQHANGMQSLKTLNVLNSTKSTTDIQIPSNISSKTNTKKISHLYANIISETVYSSDSDCEYDIIQTATKLKISNTKLEHQCPYCEKKFMKATSLLLHLNKHDQSKQTNDCETEKESIIETCKPSKNEAKYLCNKCDKTFKLASSLTNHLKIHLKQSIVAQKELISSNSLRTKPQYPCTFCKRIYYRQSHLDNHLTTHTNQENNENEEKEYCSKCNKEFDKKAMESHRQTHQPAKPHLCMVCGKGYNRSGNLSIHMRTHSNYRPFLCSVCGKSFTIRSYLTIHSRTHTQEKPFTCQHCNKGFVQKSNLIEHLRIHSGVKPHICAACGKKFTHYSGLTQHLLTHSSIKKYVCKICGKSFKQGGHYREHLRIHSGDKPFICNICSRAFASNSAYVVHTRTHTGERPYKCQVCKKGFIKSYGLTQHKKTHAVCNVPGSIA